MNSPSFSRPSFSVLHYKVNGFSSILDMGMVLVNIRYQSTITSIHLVNILSLVLLTFSNKGAHVTVITIVTPTSMHLVKHICGSCYV